MVDCEYCDKEFSDTKDRLEHELDEHEEEMTSHEKGEKKSQLNKLEQKSQVSKHNRRKKLKYTAFGVLLLGLIGGGGLFAVQSLDLNGVQQTNESAGVGTPVHWHANYKITVCGDEKVLRGGPTKAHTHGEKTFHLEGVRQTREEATLDWVVDSLGGELEEDSIMGRENCDGESANLTVKANERELKDHMNYIPQDGDFIRIRYS